VIGGEAMATTKRKSSTKSTTTIEKRVCLSCNKLKNLKTEFYLSNSPLASTEGRLNICKSCLLTKVNPDDLDNVKDILRQIDKPFLSYMWQSAIDESPTKEGIFGKYLKNISMRQFKDMTWKDSDFEIENGDTTKATLSNEDDFVLTDEIMDKWGFGYTPEEYRFFEKKYKMLRNNYPEKTALHREALLTYIRYRVKEELATAQGDVKNAKEWGALAAKAAQDAKINPSQMSKSDLTDGLDTFGQLVRTVEQAVDIIPILPKFKERPQDKVDFTLWCYINYVRDLKGLPLCEYEDIYRFYEERKKEYEQRYGKTEEEDGDE
jgi:hypothetical protein